MEIALATFANRKSRTAREELIQTLRELGISEEVIISAGKQYGEDAESEADSAAE